MKPQYAAAVIATSHPSAAPSHGLRSPTAAVKRTNDSIAAHARQVIARTRAPSAPVDERQADRAERRGDECDATVTPQRERDRGHEPGGKRGEHDRRQSQHPRSIAERADEHVHEQVVAGHVAAVTGDGPPERGAVLGDDRDRRTLVEAEAARGQIDQRERGGEQHGPQHDGRVPAIQPPAAAKAPPEPGWVATLTSGRAPRTSIAAPGRASPPRTHPGRDRAEQVQTEHDGRGGDRQRQDPVGLHEDAPITRTLDEAPLRRGAGGDQDDPQLRYQGHAAGPQYRRQQQGGPEQRGDPRHLRAPQQPQPDRGREHGRDDAQRPLQAVRRDPDAGSMEDERRGLAERGRGRDREGWTRAGVENTDEDSHRSPTPEASVTTPSTTTVTARHCVTSTRRAAPLSVRPPRDEDERDRDERRELDRGRQCADRDAEHRTAPQRAADACRQEPRHQQIVVGRRDQPE